MWVLFLYKDENFINSENFNNAAERIFGNNTFDIKDFDLHYELNNPTNMIGLKKFKNNMMINNANIFDKIICFE